MTNEYRYDKNLSVTNETTVPLKISRYTKKKKLNVFTQWNEAFIGQNDHCDDVMIIYQYEATGK